MKTRGKVLREPGAGPGLLIIDGQQYKFSLGGVWMSGIPPKPGLTVDVEMSQGLEIVGIRPVSDSQLAREQAGVAVTRAAQSSGRALNPEMGYGTRDLIALGLLAVGWFLLTTVNIALPDAGSLHFTFWQLLGLVNTGNAIEVMARGSQTRAGIYGLLALVALAAPFVHHFWNERRSILGGLAPLLFMATVWAVARNDFQSALRGYGEFGKQAQSEAMQAVSVGLGAYLSGLMSLYFAVSAVRKFLAKPAAATPDKQPKMRRAAA